MPKPSRSAVEVRVLPSWETFLWLSRRISQNPASGMRRAAVQLGPCPSVSRLRTADLAGFRTCLMREIMLTPLRLFGSLGACRQQLIFVPNARRFTTKVNWAVARRTPSAAPSNSTSTNKVRRSSSPRVSSSTTMNESSKARSIKMPARKSATELNRSSSSCSSGIRLAL
jgi:hypothetical protein